eukprot:CAMPEP_0180362580 /NCGR_PEP_ID=MMETSP0989-20121125/13474_1 /TAXON_ID=697907 /ORGANISM="non described non described, Strain CCMP2293" /LENGTH=2127 /DNA_ID=CAMNT_0022354771 /DNA_START=87 /DNA_END=6471 /DNA_ORIENTATION=+
MSAVGRDVAPEAGMRVEHASGNKGVGTITTVHYGNSAVAVRWDQGGQDSAVPTGELGKYDLVIHRKMHRMANQMSNQATGMANQANGNGNGAVDRGRSARDLLSPDWLEQVGSQQNYGAPPPSHQTVISGMGSVSGKSVQAKSTVGISVYGTVIDYLVPGGPAHLTQRLAKDDEIVEVEGNRVTAENVTGLIRGSDQVNTTLRLKVLKAASGQVHEVEIVRVSKASIASMVHLFELLTALKQNGANIEPLERQSFPPHKDLSVELVDKVVNLVTDIQGERMIGENETRKKFQGLYQELRASLLEAYDEVDRLTAAGSKDSAEDVDGEARERMAKDLGAEADRYHQQVTRLASDLEVVTQELKTARDQIQSLEASMVQERVLEKDLKDRLGAYKKAHHLTDHDVHKIVEELEVKREALAVAIEESMQRDFALKAMTADDERMRAEAAAALQAKEEELAATKRSIADKVGEMAAVKDEELSEMHRSLREVQKELHACEVEVAKRDKRLTALQGMIEERDTELEARGERLMAAAEDAELAADHQASLKQTITELEKKVLEAPWRAGDLLEVSVVAAKHLPGEHNDSMEWCVMTAIDEKHQVSQTAKVAGVDPHFNEEYTSDFSKTSRMVTAAVYCSEGGKPGELVGHCEIPLGDLPYAPGVEIAYPIMDDAGTPLHDSSGNTARIEMILCKNNYPRNREEVIEKQTAAIKALSDSLAEALATVANLSAQVAGMEENTRVLEAAAAECQCPTLKPEVPRLEALLNEAHKRRDQQTAKIAQLDQEVAEKDDMLAECSGQLVAAQESASVQAKKLREEVEGLKVTIKKVQGMASETAARTQERDALARKHKLAEEDLAAHKTMVADARERGDGLEAERKAAHVQAVSAMKKKDEQQAAVQLALSKAEGLAEKERKLFEEEKKVRVARVEELSKQVAELKSELKEVAEARGSAESEVRQLKSQLATATKDVAERNSRLEAQMTKQTGEAAELKKRLEAKIEELLAAMAKLKKEMADAKASAQAADAESRKKVATLDGVLKERDQALKQAGQEAEAKARDTATKVKSLQERIGTLEAASEKDHKEIERLRTDLNVSKEARAAGDSDRKGLGTKMDGLEEQLSKLEKEKVEMRRRIEDLKKELEGLKGEKTVSEKEAWVKHSNFESLTKEHESLTKDKASQLKDKATEIERLLAQVEGQKKELEEQRKAAIAQRDAKTAAEVSIKELQAQLAGLEKDKTALEKGKDKELAGKDKELERVGKEMEEVKKELADLRKGLDQERNGKSSAESLGKQLSTKLESLEAERKALKDEMEKLSRDLEGLREKKGAADSQVQVLSKQLEEKSKELEALKKEHAAVRDAKAASDSDGKLLVAKLESLVRERTEQASKQDADFARERATLQSQIKELQAALAEAKKEQQAAVGETKRDGQAAVDKASADFEKERASLLQQIKDLQAALDKAAKDADARVAKVEKTSEEAIKDLKEQLARLQAQADKAAAQGDKERDSASKKLEEANARANKLEHDLTDQMSDGSEASKRLEASVRDKTDQMHKLQQEVSILQGKMAEDKAILTKDKSDLQAKLEDLIKKGQQLEDQLSALKTSGADKDQEIANLLKKVKDLEGQLAAQRAGGSGKDAESANLRTQVGALEKEVADLKKGGASKDAEATNLQKQVRELEEQLATASRARAEKSSAGTSDGASKPEGGDGKDAQIASLLELLRARDASAKELQGLLEARKKASQSQEQSIKDLEAIAGKLEKEVSDQKRAALLSVESPQLSNISLDGEQDKHLLAKLAAVEDENRKLKASLSRAEARIVELEEQLQKVQKTSRDQYEQAVGALQKQVVSLQEQWKVTQRQDKDEYEAEIRRLQAQTVSLKEQIADLQRQLGAKMGMARPEAEQATRAGSDHERAPLPPPERSPPSERAVEAPSPPDAYPKVAQRGVIGIKIENKAPHKVMSLTELMDENGNIINDKVQLGDLLVEINGVHVASMHVGEVIQRVSGAVDTLVRMTFRNIATEHEYSVTALRHVPLHAAGARSAYAASDGSKRGPSSGSAGAQAAGSAGAQAADPYRRALPGDVAPISGADSSVYGQEPRRVSLAESSNSSQQDPQDPRREAFQGRALPSRPSTFHSENV